jgi:hypothetical protein
MGNTIKGEAARGRSGTGAFRAAGLVPGRIATQAGRECSEPIINIPVGEVPKRLNDPGPQQNKVKDRPGSPLLDLIISARIISGNIDLTARFDVGGDKLNVT